MRTFRTARRRSPVLAVTGIALAALALTACEDGTGTRDEGAPQPSATTSTAPTAPATGKTNTPATGQHPASNTTDTRDATDTPNQPNTSDRTGSGAAPDPNAPANRVLCNGSNLTVTAEPVPRPLNHLLITVKNTGSKTCDLMYFPHLRFDGMQWVPDAVAESKPQAVTTLRPGDSGYAGVLLSAADGSGDAGTTARELTVRFQGAGPGSDGGAAATPALPADGVHYDSSLRVTYWQSDLADALAY
ncbi:DUF4232 domain-containing protein [Streptomyces ziwulingensis]|uniref:DUF4232 domain-containing protein n=1 Tax=Streptomyces ziwulingensis TaxID=1045501 RepID=A0ABP9AR78_9ACTN